MAEETITILRVGTDEAVRSIQDLRENIRLLKGQLQELGIGTTQYQDTLTELITNQNALRGAMNATTTTLEDVDKAAAGAGRSYNSLVNQMASLRRELRGIDLDAEGGEERFTQLATQINNINDQLKQMDALQGNYQRNVGNYTSALNGLNNATAQVVRELPALSISANTFFLAISNNIPILVDNIANLRYQNELAAKRGEETVSVLKALVKSFFSWNTVLTLVITAFTLFGDKILDFIANLFRGKDAVDDMTKALDKMRDAMDTQSIGKQIADYRSLAQRYRELGDNAEEKTKFLEEYREELDATGVSVKTVDDAEKLFITGTQDYIKAIQQRAMALAGMELAAEQYKLAIEQTIKDSERLERVNAAIKNYESLPDDYTEIQNITTYSTAGSYTTRIEKTRDEMIDALKKEKASIESAIQIFIDTGNSYVDAANKLTDEYKKVLNLDDGEGTKAAKEAADETLDLLRQAEDARLDLIEEGYLKELNLSRVQYQRQIEDLKKKLAEDENLTAEGREAINQTIEALTLKGEQEQTRIMEEWAAEKKFIAEKTVEDLIAQIEKLNKEEERLAKERSKRSKQNREFANEIRRSLQEATLNRVDNEMNQSLTDNDSNLNQSEGARAENEYNIIKTANEKKLELLKQYAEDALAAGDQTAALEYQQQAADMSVEIEQNSADRKKGIRERVMQEMQTFAGNTSNLLNTLADMYEEDAENNEKAARQAKNLRIASATIDTIMGAVGAYMQSSASLPPPAGQIVGAIQAAVVLATGMAQIAKIRSTEVNKDSTPSSSTGSIQATVTPPTITPQIDQVRNITSASEEDRLNRMAYDQRVYILSSDIEASQNSRRTRVRETSF